LTNVTTGPNLTGLRGTQLSGSIIYTLVTEKEKIKNNGSNFTKWFRNLRIILAGGQKAYVLEEALGNPPAATAKTEELADFNSCKDDYDAIMSTMLFSMEPELQNHFEKYHGPY
jgi:hypothetical protein